MKTERKVNMGTQEKINKKKEHIFVKDAKLKLPILGVLRVSGDGAAGIKS